MKKIISIVLCVVVVLSMCILQGVPTSATSEEPIANMALSEELQYLEDQANQKYNKLLAIWAYDPEYIDDVNANFPSFYGGAYLNDDKDLIIQVTTLDDSIIKYFAEKIDLANVIFEEVTYSYDDLKQAKEDIVKKMTADTKDALVSSISGVGISFPQNAVNLYMITSDAAAKSNALKTEIKEKISSFDRINIIPTTGKDSPCAAVQPGTAISNRSVGIWVEDDEGNLGVLTTPHSTISEGDTIYIGSTVFGVASTPYYSGNVDAVFVERTNTSFTPSRYVSGFGFNIKSNSYINLAVGSTTYSRGKVSLTQTGEVLDTNYTTSYDLNCVLCSASCELGDSGGVVAGGGNSSSRYFAGLIAARVNSTGYQLYVRANPIIATLDVSVY